MCQEAERLRGLLSGGQQGATRGRLGHQGEHQTHLEPGLGLYLPLLPYPKHTHFSNCSMCLSLREPVGLTIANP